MRSMSGDTSHTTQRVVLTSADEGRTVPVPAGAEVILKLPEIPTSGVRWQVPEAKGLVLVSDGYEAGTPGVGAAALRVLHFHYHGGQPVTLRMVRAQAWAPQESLDARFSLRLVPLE